MDLPNRRLQAAFMFQPADLRANRAGRLSKRQQTLLSTARSTGRLAMFIFVLVMLGTMGIIAFTIFQSPGKSGSSVEPAGGATQAGSILVILGIVVAAVLLTIIIGVAISRRYIAALNTKQIDVAKGRAEVASNKGNNWRVRIGSTKLRLSRPSQLASFQPGTPYRVYYLAGPVPNILSAEVVNPDFVEAEGEADIEPAEQVEQDPIVQASKGARLVLIILGLLVLEIPIAAIWAAGLPEALRWLVVGALLIEALVFAGFALWRLYPRS